MEQDDQQAMLDEFERIRRMTERGLRRGRHKDADVNAAGVEVGIGDDAAVVTVHAGTHLVATCDTMVETVHFDPRTMSDEDIGYKAMAANVSDIAAMGGTPKYALVSVSIPRRWHHRRLERLYDGLYACADRYGVNVVGGDTTKAPRHLTISVTLMGEVKEKHALLRSSARPGDVVFVTGYPGCAAAGLHVLLARGERAQPTDEWPAPYASLVQAHQRPDPSVRAGQIIADTVGNRSALNDISDGLASECLEISRASGYGLVLYDERIPIAPELAEYAKMHQYPVLDWVLYGGEDYCLVGTAPSGPALARLKKAFEKERLPFFVIGEVSSERTRAGRLFRVDASGRTVEETRRGYNHFHSGGQEG